MPEPSSSSHRSPSPRKGKSASEPPKNLADHELLRPIASGSYGEVWLARNQVSGTFRAVKFVWSGTFDTAKPYERELDALGRFEPISRTHPGLVQILHVGRVPDGFYYVMELADDVETGQEIDVDRYQPATLTAVKARGVTVQGAIRIGIELADALSALHDAGLIHRDIKPSNVIFARGVPKLADIGLVAVISEANSLVGTNGFIAPEGPTTGKSDIFSLGKLIYEVATGKDRLEFPALPENVSERETLLLELNQVLLKACDPDPRRRHACVRRLRGELESLEQGRSVMRVRQLERALRWTRASLLTVLLAAGAVFFAVHAARTSREAARVLLERKITTALVQGMERVKEGDYLTALNYFAHAAVWDRPSDPEHQLRLGTTLLFTPKVARHWESDSDVAAFTAEGHLLATVQGNKIRVLDIRSDAVVQEIPGRADFMDFDPAGERLAITDNERLTILNVKDWTREERTFDGFILHASMTDSPRMAVTVDDNSVHLLPENQVYRSAEGEIYRGLLSPSSALLAVLYVDGSVRMLRADTLEPLPFLARHDSMVYEAAFIRDETVLVTCSFDRRAVAWNLADGSVAGYPMEHEDGVFYAAESPDKTQIATGSLDRTVKLWGSDDFSRRARNHTLYHPDHPLWVKFADSGGVIAHCNDGRTWLWALEVPEVVSREVPFAIAPPDKSIINNGAVQLSARDRVLSGVIGAKKFTLTLPAPIETFAVHPGLEKVAVGTIDPSRAPHSVLMFDLNGERLGPEMPHRDGVTYVAFSPSGRLLVSCSEDFTARIWNEAGQPVTPVLRHRHQVRWAGFNQTEEWVATGSYDGTVRIWNARSGLAVTPPLPVGNIVDYVVFQNGAELFVGNTKRNYIIRLEYFTGDPRELLQGSATPSDWLQALDRM